MNYIETMNQALEALEDRQSPHSIRTDVAISCLRAAIDAAEKQKPAAYGNLDARIDVINRALFLRCEKEAADKYHENCYDLAALFTHPAPSQPDSEQAKIGCIGHDGDCCKDREQIYLDAARYWWLRSKDVGPSQIWELLSDDCQPPYMTLKCGHDLDAAIDAAMKVGADTTGETK